MRRILWVAVVLVGLVAAGFGALLVFLQISEKAIEWTCSPTEPDKTCQNRMVAMGHTWSLKGNVERATIWYARAAQRHHPAALFHLGWALEEGGIAELKDLLRQIGDPNNALAEMIETENNPRALSNSHFEAAAKAYRMSADQGFAPAMNNLAELYFAGVLGGKRAEEAFRLHLSAARAGNPIAAMNVSLDYRTGRGVAVDPAEAEKWATVVPRDGSPDLGTLTMRRTRLQGMPADPRVIAGIQAAAERHEPVTMTLKPMTPDPRLPTFRQVQDNLRASSSR